MALAFVVIETSGASLTDKQKIGFLCLECHCISRKCCTLNVSCFLPTRKCGDSCLTFLVAKAELLCHAFPAIIDKIPQTVGQRKSPHLRCFSPVLCRADEKGHYYRLLSPWG